MPDTNLVAILKTLEPVFERLTGRPHGVGFTLHIAPDPESGTLGYVFRCAGSQTGATDMEGNLILVRHDIGIVSKGPGNEDHIAIESPGDAVFTLDPSQGATWDPGACLCHCGQPVSL